MATKKKMLLSSAGTAAGGGGALDIDDVFSTFVYAGTGSAQTITNSIDLDGEGGLVVTKRRDSSTGNGPYWNDTERGITSYVRSDSDGGTGAQNTSAGSISSVTSSGYVLGTFNGWNNSSGKYVSWTWRKAPKFFTICEWTGTGSTQTISHDLSSNVGFLIIKRTDTSGGWMAYHRKGFGSSWGFRRLDNNTLFIDPTSSALWSTYIGNGSNFVAPTSTEFLVNSANDVNANGGTYVAYLFAHNDGDGEFGPDADQDIIKCGSYTGAALPNEINVGFEPQFVMIKNASHAGDWMMFDAMRGVVNSAYPNLDNTLFANSTAAERTNTGYIGFTPTGFLHQGGAADTNTANNKYIYMAVRRGPLAVATDPTKVFKSIAYTGSGSGGGNKLTTGFPVDLAMIASRTGTQSWKHAMISRLSSGDRYIPTNSNVAEINNGSGINLDDMTGYDFDGSSFNGSGPFISHNWKRAPGHFDAVCYSGSNSAKTVSHNLTVTPEMMWVKSRSNGNRWTVFHKDMGPTKRAFLDLTQAFDTGSGIWNNTAPTSAVFTVGTDSNTNYSGHTFISYLFATAPGVSMVGTINHSNGTASNVDCGFSNGARFVLVKRSDGTGNWYVWDSARGIVSGADKRLYLNGTAAENTGNDDIDPYAAGFTWVSTWTTGSYIFYAIA